MSESEHEIEARRQLKGFERVLGAVAPKWAFSRAVAREQLHQFAAVRQGKARGKPATAFDQASSESWRKQRERLDAIWEARAMVENFCILNGMMQRLGKYIVGSLEYQPETGGGKTVNERYKEYFHDWCGRADYTGRHRFRTLVQLGLVSAIRDGEFGFVEHMVNGELRLQAIEGDRIGNPQSPVNDETNIGGIKIDETGTVTGYEIYKRSRTVQYTKEGEVAPDHFIHLFFPDRVDQYRGVSRLAPALPHARDMYELLGHEKIAAKFASSYAAIIRSKDVGAPGSAQWEESPQGTGHPASMRAQAGTVLKLEQGVEDIEFAPGVQRPSGAFMALWEALVREIALALDLPYGFCYNMASFNGVTARLETQAAQRTFAWYQELLIQIVLDRVKRKVLMHGIAKREIPYTKFWERGTWRFGATLTGDIGHQVQADLDLVRAGVKTRTQIAAEYNNDIREVIEKNGEEIQIAMEVSKKRGVPIELLLRDLDNPTALIANFERAKNGDPDPNIPPPPPGLIGTVGDKGVKGLLDVVMAVNKGEMDRDSGINTAVTVYGMTYVDAEALFPAVPVKVEGETPRRQERQGKKK